MSTSIDAVKLSLLYRRLLSISEEMSLVLRRTAYSPNIKERADFSCAIFDRFGNLIAQAEAIPVHLGSMPFVAKPVIQLFPEWQEGDAIVTNSPRSEFGGTHLPDVTLLAPVFEGNHLRYVVANRAHHADMGGKTPGSLPADSTEIFQEGLIIPPVRLFIKGLENQDIMNFILENVRTPDERRGDLRAQYSSLMVGVRRIKDLMAQKELQPIELLQKELLRRSEVGTRERLMSLGKGEGYYEDFLDTDGFGGGPVKITCTVTLPGDGSICFDFSGSDKQQAGNCNAPLSVTTSACFYVVRLLTGSSIPTNSGCFAPIKIIAPEDSVVNPEKNAATSSANTETSSRIVDVVMGAIAKIIPWPSASQGTMNNLLIGGIHLGKAWSIYETIGGGTGAGPDNHGTSGIQSHMTNTENTPIEALELAYPLRVREYSIRQESGGQGDFDGGNGIVREIELLDTATITLQSERREFAPYGQGAGTDGLKGRNSVFYANPNRRLKEANSRKIISSYKYKNKEYLVVKSKVSLINLEKGSRIRIETPGGGAYSQ
ncbi:MAG: hydantoinase B/oxoprolinase family protein [Candidatus Heimdallarchaeota archaeon]|nr:hydantoinase B/oxoprolinase family protein [Candidatus Heimdallarchaeota archaeon]